MPAAATQPFRFTRFIPEADRAPAPADARSVEERLAEAEERLAASLAEADRLREELDALRERHGLVDAMELPSITAAQARVLQMILDFREANGVSPSFREIADVLDFASLQAASSHIDRLLAKGWLRRLKGNRFRSCVPTVRSIPPAKVSERREPRGARR